MWDNLTSSQEMQMVLHGLLGGITQVCYVVFLLYLLLYIYAIAGIIFFADNDPWNFYNVDIYEIKGVF